MLAWRACPDSCATVFGLGDSCYVQYNVAAKKLDRRLAQLGATPVVDRGLGDDQHPTGYEAALDPWLAQLWPALRQLYPPAPRAAAEPASTLPPFAAPQLADPKFRVSTLGGEHVDAAATVTCSNAAAATALQPTTTMGQQQLAAAVHAAAAFRRVAAHAAGMPINAEDTGSACTTANRAPNHSGGAASGQGDDVSSSSSYGPWRPFMAPMVVNTRITAPSHFQDTRHIEFDLTGSGLTFEPGDLLAIFPQTPPEAVGTLLARLGLDGNRLVRVTAANPPCDGWASEQQDAADNSHGQANGSSTQQDGSSSAAAPAVAAVATVRELVAGVLDIAGASPRRYFFQVLSHFATAAHERDRLAYFGSAEGREDLHR